MHALQLHSSACAAPHHTRSTASGSNRLLCSSSSTHVSCGQQFSVSAPWQAQPCSLRQTHTQVLTPPRSEASATVQQPAIPAQLPRLKPADLISEISAPVVDDMVQMNSNLRHIVGDRSPMLMAAADQIFGAGGKKLRPMIVFLVARATAHMAGMK